MKDLELNQQNDQDTLKQGTFKNGEDFRLLKLGPDDLDAIFGLHQHVVETLDSDEKAYMLPKSRDYFHDHFEKASGNTFLGLDMNGYLVAMSMVNHPVPAAPDTGMVDMPSAPPALQTSLLQAVCVHETFRGNGLMAHMVGEWIKHAFEHDRDHVVAEIDIHNVASWYSFMKQGLDIVSIGVDQSDGTVVYNMHGETNALARGDLRAAFNHHTNASVQNIAAQKELLAKGHRVTGFDKDTGLLTFSRPRNG